jgi:hypothetical protein
MGASIVVVLLALIIVAVGLLVFLILGAYNAGAWLALLYVPGMYWWPWHTRVLIRTSFIDPATRTALPLACGLESVLHNEHFSEQY